MKYFLTIFILITYKASAQYANWVTGKETYVNSYQVEKSTDGNNYVSIANIQPEKKDTNYYSVKLASSAWYRIKAIMISGTFYTKSLYYSNKPPSVFIEPLTQSLQL